MAIDHELSSEIAMALLTGEREPGELQHLKEMVFRVHATLQELTTDSRRKRIPVTERREEEIKN